MSIRFLVFLSILGLLTTYTAFKISPLFPQRRLVTVVLALAVVALAVSWQFLYRSNPSSVLTDWYRLYMWLGALVLGVWATFLLFSLPVDLMDLLWTAFRKAVPPANDLDFARRDLLTKISVATLGLSGVIAALGFREVANGPKIKSVSLTVPDLPPSLRGFKIAQISDLHVGPTIHRDYVSSVVGKVLELKPDLIAITGDLADGSPQILEEHLKPLGDLKAQYGTYYVTGNHEYYWDANQWIAKAGELGFITLLNENRTVDVNGAKVLVGGVTDTSAHGFISSHLSDPKKAAATTDVCDFKILLAHRPDSCIEAEPAGFHLQLSGHTHAGQFFPWNLLVSLAHKYYQGLNRHQNMWVYVNAGTGYWGPPHRFSVPSEITEITLS